MLVLSRRAGMGESILITKDGELVAEVCINSIDRNQVKIAIQAPKDVVLIRNELLSESELAKLRGHK